MARWRRAAACLLAGVLALAGCAVATEEKPHTVVRVGYPIQAGLSEVNENGERSGYTYEYLEEIAQYTGWEYEFVEAPGDANESIITLMDMLEKGEIDLMGGMLYSDAMNELYDFVEPSYGEGYTVLYAAYDNRRIDPDNYQSMQGMRVATLTNAKTRQGELADFCEENGLSYELVLCETEEESKLAIKDGRADVLLGVDMNPEEEMRTVARFAGRPFYFATTKGNTALANGVCQAILSISEVDPSFSSKLYERYFGNQQTGLLFLSEPEREYIESVGTLRVGFVLDHPPFQYMDPDTGAPKGISLDLIDYIGEKTGLTFELVMAPSEEEVGRMLLEGEIDLAAGVTFDYDLARRYNMSMTRPYISAPYVIMLGRDVNVESIAGERLALPKPLTYEGYFVGELTLYDSMEACIDAINSKRADYTYCDSYAAQYYVNLPKYRNLRLIPQSFEEHSTCIGVARPVDQRLMTVLNKTILSMREEDIQSIIFRNTVLRQDYSLRSMIEANPAMAVLAVVIFALLIIACLTAALYVRIRRDRQAAVELKKHYQLYELSNEHFFEYDVRKNSLTISQKLGGSGAADVQVYSDKHELSEEHGELFEEFVEQVKTAAEGMQDIRCRVLDGAPRWLRMTVRHICDGAGAPVYIVGKITDIEQEKRERAVLMDRAQRDGLTQLFNAAVTRERIAERLTSGTPGAMLIIDLDHFKDVNDSFGHLTGDKVLCQLADILRDLFRKSDIEGRLGGDEMAVYMDYVPDRKTVAMRCDALMDRVRSLNVDGCRPTLSVGAALTRPGEEYDDLYQRTDAALYKAKEEGRDRYHID